MKQLLSKLLSFLKSPFKPKPKVTIRHIFNQLQTQSSALDDIAFWFGTNPSQATKEIADQLENASSRLQALTSAVLIAIRDQEEQQAIKRINERLNERKK